MASSLQLILVFVLLHAILLLPNPVHCDVEEDNLLQGINSYGQSLNLPPLAKNDKAMRLADEIAGQLEDQPCVSNTGPITMVPGSNYRDLLEKCNIDANTTEDGVILPVCVPKLVPTLVLTNYTHSRMYSKYLNNSSFIGAGVGSEDDWMVLVLATNTLTGSFVSGADLVSAVGLWRCVVVLVVVGVVVLVLCGINLFGLKKGSHKFNTSEQHEAETTENVHTTPNGGNWEHKTH